MGGFDDVKSFRPKEIGRTELALLSLLGSKTAPTVVAEDGRRRRWIGVGWVDDGVAYGDEVVVVDDPTKRRTLRLRSR
jgi:hypothetical protein